MSKRWYEHWLRKASTQEIAGNLARAIRSLDKAEKHESDDEELKYLNMWRNRLKAELKEKS